jgi:hypothetical protein
MNYLLVRNRITDFDQWKRVLDLHALAQREAGQTLRHVWRDLDSSNEILLLFEVANLPAARSFLSAPELAESGKAAGVVDGEYRFLRDVPGF